MSDELIAETLSNLWLVALDCRKATWEAEWEEREVERKANQNTNRVNAAGHAVDNVTLQSRQSREHFPEIIEKILNLVAGMLVSKMIEYLPMHFAIKKLREYK